MLFRVLLMAVGLGVQAPLPPLPAPMGVPSPGPEAAGPYQPQPILAGGVVLPLYPPNSPFLNQSRAHEPEKYNMSKSVPGRINSIVNIHNPSIEFHPVDTGLNTGTAVILVAGGGHRTLNVGSEAADFVPFFYNYGVNTVILRNRLRSDGYDPQKDGVNDALQAIRLVRAHATDWGLNPNKIGMIGFSAGAELTAAAAVLFPEFDKQNGSASDPLAGVSSRPDFAGIIYPGPSPFAKNRVAPEIPNNEPPSFVICGGSGDKVHAVWAMEYFSALLNARGAKHRDAYLRQRPSPGRPATGWQPYERRSYGQKRHSFRHLAISLYRLVSRLRFPAEAGTKIKACRRVKMKVLIDLEI